MAFTRLLRNLARDKKFGPRVVPIVPDEARTFGMDSLFREFEIYAPFGQRYEPVDHALLLSYTEDQDGQILEEGITEAGGLASWTAAATSYANRGTPMLPFFIFYSMFGFQRVGDLIWAAADARARGFLLGATAGRTTLLGEGLQHQDGHSLLLASTVPGLRGLRPGLRLRAGGHRPGRHRPHVPGRRRRRGRGRLLLPHPLQRELRRCRPSPTGSTPASSRASTASRRRPRAPPTPPPSSSPGSAQGAAREAQAELAEHYDVGVDLWSATSYKRLREEAMAAERWNRLHPGEAPRTPLVTERLAEGAGPIVAVTDFMRAVPDQVSRWSPRPWSSLGTDGVGRSDTRETLRRFFETDAAHVVVAVLAGLACDGAVDRLGGSRRDRPLRPRSRRRRTVDPLDPHGR